MQAVERESDSPASIHWDIRRFTFTSAMMDGAVVGRRPRPRLTFPLKQRVLIHLSNNWKRCPVSARAPNLKGRHNADEHAAADAVPWSLRSSARVIGKPVRRPYSSWKCH